MSRGLTLTVLITGVSPNGLGASLAQTLAAQSPSLLILTGRSTVKVKAVEKIIKATYPNVPIRILKLDLVSFDSVRSAAAEINAYDERSIDILINNAGVMNIPERTLSADGFEMHLATNYLGSFLFTSLIMDKLTANDGARIVNMSSNGYMFSPFRFADYNFEGDPLPEEEKPPKALCYLPTIAYGQSKTAIILYSVQLSKLLANKGVTVVCVHPGCLCFFPFLHLPRANISTSTAIATDPWRHMSEECTEQIFTMMPMKTPSQGISTALVAALDPKLSVRDRWSSCRKALATNRESGQTDLLALKHDCMIQYPKS
ncbi:short-chain dehydrogenase protein [Rutstroemia sp. NJR-2017a WRK4]|nr:short-chain dehydrogenase protein [Rutstroemia sp. NJR-2017a WRK4]